MPGKNVIVGAQSVEYAEESSFATELQESTSWNWFGIVNSWSAEQGVESESITYLPEYNADNKLEKRINVKLREMYSGDVTYHPQGSFDFLKYFTGEIGGTSDQVPSIQIGEVNESVDPDEFRRLMGGVGEEVTVSVEEDGVAEVSGSFIFADAEDWVDIDYVGDTGITSLSNSVTPTTDDSVGVKTDTVDTGEVLLYDGSDQELARVNADSTSYIAADVGGTDVAGVRLVNTDTSVTSETISVNPETDGTGIDETATVDSSGEHALEDTTEPWSYGSLSNVQYGGTDMSGMIESVELTISNELAEVRDPNVSRGTQLASLVPVDREITVSVDFTYENFDILQDVRSYTAKDFTFTIGNTTFTVGDVKFPSVPYEYTADDLVSDSLDSDPASSVTWTTA